MSKLGRPSESEVFNYVPREASADERFRALIEQYKAYMTTLADSSNARRTFHAVFISINSLLFFAISLTSGNGETLVPIDRNMLFFVNTVGVLTSIAWFFIVLRYRARSAEAACLLSEVENHLPARFLQAEFERLEARFSPLMQRLLSVELWIPWAFALIHLAIGIGVAIGLFNLGVSVL